MHTNISQELAYRRYQVHLRVINRLKPVLIGRFYGGRLHVGIASHHRCTAGRRLDTIFRIKNYLASGRNL